MYPDHFQHNFGYISTMHINLILKIYLCVFLCSFFCPLDSVETYTFMISRAIILNTLGEGGGHIKIQQLLN